MVWVPAVMSAAGSAHSQVEVPGTVDCGDVRVHSVEVVSAGSVSVTVTVPGAVEPGIRVERLSADRVMV